jgi:hypothetical protein
MNESENCILCDSVLGSDFTILGSQNYIETLSFLKGVVLDQKKYKVCLVCFEKLNFISSFRSQKKPDPQVETTSNVSVSSFDFSFFVRSKFISIANTMRSIGRIRFELLNKKIRKAEQFKRLNRFTNKNRFRSYTIQRSKSLATSARSTPSRRTSTSTTNRRPKTTLRKATSLYDRHSSSTFTSDSLISIFDKLSLEASGYISRHRIIEEH